MVGTVAGLIATIFLAAYIGADMGRRGQSQWVWFTFAFVLTLPLALVAWLVARAHYPIVQDDVPSAR